MQVGLLLAGAPHADGQVFGAICINISENDQDIAVVMVTVGATQCMTRAKRKRNAAAAIWLPWLCQYDFGNLGGGAARLSLVPCVASCATRASCRRSIPSRPREPQLRLI
jgi:hypothetical protein